MLFEIGEEFVLELVENEVDDYELQITIVKDGQTTSSVLHLDEAKQFKKVICHLVGLMA